MTSKPLVSIGMPLYNAELYLEKALNSILSQTFRDFELIISDNGSLDQTVEICQSYALQDKRIHFFRSKSNLGAAWNFNRVFSLSHGIYFKWSAHDDEYEPTYLERLVETFKRAPFSTVLCYPKTKLIDHNGDTIKNFEDKLELRGKSPHNRLLHFIKNVSLCNPVFGLIRSEALQRTRLIDKFVGSDRVLLAELALLGEFWEIPEALFKRRRHATSSGAANHTFLEVAVWFDPKNRNKSEVYPANRWFIEYLKSIMSSPISILEKVQCTQVFIWEWYIKQNWRNIGGEWKIALKHLIRIQNHPSAKKRLGDLILP